MDFKHQVCVVFIFLSLLLLLTTNLHLVWVVQHCTPMLWRYKDGQVWLENTCFQTLTMNCQYLELHGLGVQLVVSILGGVWLTRPGGLLQRYQAGSEPRSNWSGVSHKHPIAWGQIKNKIAQNPCQNFQEITHSDCYLIQQSHLIPILALNPMSDNINITYHRFCSFFPSFVWLVLYLNSDSHMWPDVEFKHLLFYFSGNMVKQCEAQGCKSSISHHKGEVSFQVCLDIQALTRPPWTSVQQNQEKVWMEQQS